MASPGLLFPHREKKETVKKRKPKACISCKFKNFEEMQCFKMRLCSFDTENGPPKVWILQPTPTHPGSNKEPWLLVRGLEDRVVHHVRGDEEAPVALLLRDELLDLVSIS